MTDKKNSNSSRNTERLDSDKPSVTGKPTGQDRTGGKMKELLSHKKVEAKLATERGSARADDKTAGKSTKSTHDVFGNEKKNKPANDKKQTLDGFAKNDKSKGTQFDPEWQLKNTQMKNAELKERTGTALKGGSSKIPSEKEMKTTPNYTKHTKSTTAKVKPAITKTSSSESLDSGRGSLSSTKEGPFYTSNMKGAAGSKIPVPTPRLSSSTQQSGSPQTKKVK